MTGLTWGQRGKLFAIPFVAFSVTIVANNYLYKRSKSVIGRRTDLKGAIFYDPAFLIHPVNYDHGDDSADEVLKMRTYFGKSLLRKGLYPTERNDDA